MFWIYIPKHSYCSVLGTFGNRIPEFCLHRMIYNSISDFNKIDQVSACIRNLHVNIKHIVRWKKNLLWKNSFKTLAWLKEHKWPSISHWSDALCAITKDCINEGEPQNYVIERYIPTKKTTKYNFNVPRRWPIFGTVTEVTPSIKRNWRIIACQIITNKWNGKNYKCNL